jgi:hypothetical protein
VKCSLVLNKSKMIGELLTVQSNSVCPTVTVISKPVKELGLVPISILPLITNS